MDKHFKIFNYSSVFLYVLNSCKNLPEDDLEMIETYRSFDGLCMKKYYIHTYIHTYIHILHTYEYIHTYIHYIHTYIHYIHTYIHAYITFIVGKEYGNETIQTHTDGSRNEQGVGAGVAMFSGNELVTTLKYRLDNKCSNNQAEQLAIANALEGLEKTDIEKNSPRTAAVITDSKIYLDSIKNMKNHSYLIEEIRERLLKLERSNWKVTFVWVKAHVGILGNELADDWPKQRRGMKI